MTDWERILKFEERPALSSLGLSPTFVSRGKKRNNAYEDVIQICSAMFATINRRYKIGVDENDYITAFFWAEDDKSLLRAVYGDLSAPVIAPKRPPNELLINPDRFRYRELVEDAVAKKLNPSEHFIWSSIASATGLCLTIYRHDYYFVCSQDESAEFKIWDKSQPIAIGFRTFLGKRIGNA